jgi:4'-phosphopantetheinyl transferase
MFSNDFFPPPKSPNAGGLSIKYSPQSWGARGAKTYLESVIQFSAADLILEAQTVHLWWISLDVSEENLQTFISLLSEAEKTKAERFKFPQHQRRYQAVHGILRIILGRYLSLAPTQINFTHSDRGKPYLTDDCNPVNLQFNLSHSENMAIVGISRDRPIGVDLEKIRPMENAEPLAERFFCASEYDLLTQAIPEERDQLFFQFWTAKEAYLKATGEGISGGLNQIEIAFNPLRFINFPNWYLQSFSPNPDDRHSFWAAIAVEGKGENIEVKCFSYL